MNNKNKTWFVMIIIGYIAVLVAFVLVAYIINVVSENKITAIAENQPTAIECGSCGAHVYEYWYVENINDGTPVEVCRYCYENCIENTATEN